MKTSLIYFFSGALMLGPATWAQTAPASAAPAASAPAASSPAVPPAPAADATTGQPSRGASGSRGTTIIGGGGGVRGTIGTQAPAPEPLKENVSLSLKGEILPGVPIEVVFTGVGPQFRAQVPLPDSALKDIGEKNFTTVAVTMGEKEGGYEVSYELSAQVLTTTPGANGAPERTTMRPVGLKGKATLKLGEQVESTPDSNTSQSTKPVILKLSPPAIK